VPAGRSDAVVRRFRLARVALEERDVRCTPRFERGAAGSARKRERAVTAFI
jgi:hypothetical protein